MDNPEDAFFNDLIAAVEQQLTAPDTRYVKKAYDLLVKSGLSDEEAKETIAECLAEESDAMFRGQRPFDEKNYRALLEMTRPSG